MKSLGGYVEDAYIQWLNSLITCCGALQNETPRHGIEKPMRIEHQQPHLIPPPIAQPEERQPTRGREWAERSKSFASRASSRGSLAVRRRLTGYNEQRRPLIIGAPSDFRHVENGIQRRTAGFRPLELSIYLPQNQLSPILPHFSEIDNSWHPNYLKDLPCPPPIAQTHSRTDSGSSFNIRRKPIGSSSRASSEWTAGFQPGPGSLNTQELLAALEAQVPTAPPAARLRAMTTPPAYERVKSALYEKLELEQRLKDIDELIDERQSLYLSSRPTSRATSTRTTSIYVESYEPMPATKPSFRERISSSSDNQRPGTAPSKLVPMPTVLNPVNEETSALNTPALGDESFVLPPPLPLVLQAPPRPQLRKKKSFSRVSTWLFPGPDHSRNLSFESVTNTPQPVTSRDGFYQCVDLRQADRSSFTSVSTISTMETELDDLHGPTTGTPASSPGGSKRDATIGTLSIDSEMKDEGVELTRLRTFGEEDVSSNYSWRIESIPTGPVREGTVVGMAF